jgi:VWFA-related protein
VTRVALLLGAIVLLTPRQSPIFRSSVDFVAVDVSVRRGERPVNDLTAADFELRDTGVVQTIADFGFESWPIDVTLVVDISGSVSGPLLASLTRAVDRVAATLRPTDRVHLVTFNQYLREQASPAAALSSSLGVPSGGTSLFDALVAASIRPRDPGYRPVLIAFTDGDDSMSFLPERTVREVARRAGTTCFMVAAVDAVRQADDPLRHRPLYDAMTAMTGGELTVIGRNQDVGDAFVRALSTFRTSYVLRYSPEGVNAGGWHPISVRVTRPGRYDVRSRQGYFATSAGTDDASSRRIPGS